MAAYSCFLAGNKVKNPHAGKPASDFWSFDPDFYTYAYYITLQIIYQYN